MAIRELLFYAECQLQAMIAENKQRERQGLALAYAEEQFLTLAEQTRGAYRQFS